MSHGSVATQFVWWDIQ